VALHSAYAERNASRARHIGESLGHPTLPYGLHSAAVAKNDDECAAYPGRKGGQVRSTVNVRSEQLTQPSRAGSPFREELVNRVTAEDASPESLGLRS
jgi:hypothetical protein